MLDFANCFLYSTNLGVREDFAQRQALTWIVNMLNSVYRGATYDSYNLTAFGIQFSKCTRGCLHMRLKMHVVLLAERADL